MKGSQTHTVVLQTGLDLPGRLEETAQVLRYARRVGVRWGGGGGEVEGGRFMRGGGGGGGGVCSVF